jgi:hypothetical protein
VLIKQKNKNTTEYIPINPKKYTGRYPILVRSSWERLFMQFCDLTDTVINWSSENVVIPYYDPVKQKKRRYYPDFWVKIRNKKGKADNYIIEIKPDRETRPPVMRGKKSKKTQHLQELTYLTNQAKWKAASSYCQKMGFRFKILTEKKLFTEYGTKKKF